MSGDFRKYPEIELALADMGVQPRLVKDARQERSQTSRDLWALQHKQQVILARDYESNGESGV